MKYVTGQNELLRVIELPDDARPITADDELVLAAREGERLARENEYKQRAAAAAERLAKETRIGELKRMLNKTDYQAIKFAEGEMPAEEYASVKARRAAWRAEINEIEGQLIGGA